MPVHGGDVKRSLLKLIIKQAGLSEDEARPVRDFYWAEVNKLTPNGPQYEHREAQRTWHGYYRRGRRPLTGLIPV